MAWFSSILNGVGNAASWLVSNSGLINGVLETVGTVAKGKFPGTVTTEGYVIVENTDISEEDCDCGENLVNGFKKATTNLEKAAQQGGEQPPPMPPNGSQESAILSGLWTNPGVTLDGAATPEMYRDMGKFLAENNIPTELKTSSGSMEDVSHHICAAIFADAPGIPEASEIDGVAIKMPTFKIGGDGCTISGTHAYYSIPLGKRSEGSACDDQAWHGAVRVTKTTTQAFDAEHRKEMKKDFFVAQDVEMASVGPRWVVTCQVDWRTISLARNSRDKLKAEFEKNYPTYKILHLGVAGQSQTIKIQAPEGDTPAKVRALLNKVVTNVAKTVTQAGNQTIIGEPLSDSMLSAHVRSVLNLVISETERKLTGQMLEPGNGTIDPTLQTPEVTVTNSTLVI
ncbi:uncharacterized protein N7496_011094 [Penicillium cataractarum]|uniref:Uncharacterized protein n=1 Tax=Penicillium cataractarum TaxID=2100454 RepID=A0A9W9REH2_9EURO|nr:uncharacterized protein N7496_011094 [Penicillium cataractarum]KAJ5358681.1 hypothetical protein N7496_011094 [Penicillium cataractarum]